MSKYEFSNEHLLDVNNWSSAAAYIAGFTVADGNVVSEPYTTVQYTVRESNIDILKYIKKQFGFNGHIYRYKQHGIFNGENVVVLHLRSDVIVRDMLRLGILPGKTYLQLSTFQICRKLGYYRDFVRGYFDGDGCFSRYVAKSKSRPNAPDNVRTFFVCKVRNNLQVLGEFLKEDIGIIPKIYPVGDSWRLQYGGRETLALYDYMYHNCNGFYIAEKKSIIDNWLEYRGMKDNYATYCERCGNRFVRMNKGDKICKKCRKELKKIQHQAKI